MEAHNNDTSIPAPTNLAALEAWNSRLEQEYQNYSSTWNSLENTSISLNSRREGLDNTYNTLMSSEEKSWISYYPIGIVKDISVYW
jgi:hypothetical protein